MEYPSFALARASRFRQFCSHWEWEGLVLRLKHCEMLFPKHTMPVWRYNRGCCSGTSRTRMLASRCTGATTNLSDPPCSYIYSVADTYFDHLTCPLRFLFGSLCRMTRTFDWVRSKCETLEGLHTNYTPITYFSWWHTTIYTTFNHSTIYPHFHCYVRKRRFAKRKVWLWWEAGRAWEEQKGRRFLWQ